MPYIKPLLREQLKAALQYLASELRNIDDDARDGALNYAITYLLRALYPQSYYDLNRSMGVLLCAALEHYRTVLAPYEDTKRAANGDVEVRA